MSHQRINGRVGLALCSRGNSYGFCSIPSFYPPAESRSYVKPIIGDRRHHARPTMFNVATSPALWLELKEQRPRGYPIRVWHRFYVAFRRRDAPIAET